MTTATKPYRPPSAKQFARMTNRGQRIAIARDVLAQLRMGNYVAQNNVWLVMDAPRFVLAKENGKVDLQEFLKTEVECCLVCGIGACFTSLIRIKDDLFCSLEGDWNGKILVEQQEKRLTGLKQIFGVDYALIEIAFELGDGAESCVNTSGDLRLDSLSWGVRRDIISICGTGIDIKYALKKTVSFGKRYRSSKGRMKAIMQHIIDHNGKFRPWE